MTLRNDRTFSLDEDRPTGWCSVAASAAQISLKNDDLVREAVNCNAGLGERAWLPTTVLLPQSYHVSFAAAFGLWLRNEAGARQASARSGACVRFVAPDARERRSFADSGSVPRGAQHQISGSRRLFCAPRGARANRVTVHTSACAKVCFVPPSKRNLQVRNRIMHLSKRNLQVQNSVEGCA